ncbi:MAG: PDZ domain-containing protein [Rubripirellula sp.]|nr:PDZ domain-containing protein [Rubripirellula sp.]
MNVKTFPSLRSAVTSLIFIVMMQQSNAADYYVAVDGSDTNPGSLEKPFKTITRARDAVRADGERGNKPVTVYLRGGTHYLPEAIAFGPQDSGSTNAPVTYAAYQNEAAVLSGGIKLDLDWKAYRDEILVAKTPEDIEIDQLFIDGNRQRMARYPNYEENAAAYNGSAADAFEPSRAKHWKDPTGGYIHAMHRHHWGGYHYRITGKDADNRVTYEGGWQNNRQMGMHPSLRMVENLFEELDAPREWYHDAKNNLLYYMPDSGTHLKTAKVEVVRLRHLVEFQGSKTEPVKHISLQGLTLRHTARTFMETKEPLLRSDWTIYRGGAVLMTGTDSISILDCEFDQVGGNAIFVNNYNRHSVIRGCHIHGAGASGICFVGDPNTVRNPRFEYQQQNQYDEIDKTAGPKTNNYPADCVVDNCLIHHMSVVEKQATGVQISMSKGIKVSHCSIYNLGRAGINISEGTFGGHVIEFCDVFDTVRETGDHGSFNSWGRDRFWHLPGAPKEELPALSKLDTVKTIIRNSRWRCDHGWDVDLDDGSSHYEIYNNVFLSGGLKLREGFGRKVYNNIAVNNTLHPHVWYDNSQDIVTGNIWMDGYRPAGGMPKGKWGKEVDRNLFTSEADRDQFRQHDCDQHSVVGDPMFVDAEKGDYRVKEGSPAHRIGFKNFPMDQFGVKKPSLKAIARTPVIPILKSSQQNSRRRSENQPNPKTAAKPQVDWIWLGATLKSLAGSEFSAYGISKTDGGIVLVKSPQGSEATRLGLQAGDVIQQVNGKPVKTTGALLRTLVDVGPAPYQLKMVRSQQATEIRIAKHSYVHTEIASELSDFKKLPLKDAKQSPVTANQNTNNQPLATLTDGRLAKDYGPVFSNGVHHGAYKLDLGSVKPVTAITSWSFNQSGTRGGQKIILLGSAATNDPGWNLTRFTPIGSIDTAGKHGATYTAASLRAAANGSLGSFRWIVWQVVPVTDNANGENTAYQELQVQFETD